MEKIISGIVIASMLLSCHKEKTVDRILPATDKDGQEIIRNTIKINKDKNTVKERFPARKAMTGLRKSRILSDILLKISGSRITAVRF
jgi:hypothetical protein